MAILSLIVALVSLLLLYLFVKWRHGSQFWSSRRVPHVTPHPIWGSLTFLQQKNVGLWMQDIYNKFSSPYVGIWLFWRPALVVNSPEIGRRILVKDFDIFRNRLAGSGSEFVDPIGGLNLFSVNEPTWSLIRKRLSPIFTSSKLKSMHCLFSNKSKELRMRIENDFKANKPSELRTIYSDYTSDIIGIAAFGVNCDATLTGSSPIRTITKEFMEYSIIRGIAWCCIFFVPELVKIFRFQFFPTTSVNYFRRVYKEVLAQRGGYMAGVKENDLLDALRKFKYEADQSGEAISEDLVISQAVVFLQGGFDTSSNILTYITYELAQHPAAQERAYKELLEAKQKIGDKDLDETVFRDLQYLNCIIKEALRKYPPMGWLDRVCEKEYRVDEKLVIPAGTNVYVNAIGMHYDPQYYPEPDKFDPDRHLPENDDGSKPFMPFGEGPRHCIGMRFAYLTLWYAITEVMLKYQFVPLPGAKKPSELEVEKRGLFYIPGEPLYVKFVPRK